MLGLVSTATNAMYNQHMANTEAAQPANYPVGWNETLIMENGAEVTIRPILPADAPRLQEGFSHLSPQTIYFRFLEAANQISDNQALRLASVDYESQMALVAAIKEEGQERLVGVARYALVGAEDPGAAETAVVVRDDFQGQGLGTRMYAQLIRYAQIHGVKNFVGTIHQSNVGIITFIKRNGLTFERHMVEPGVFQITVKLSD